MEKHTVNKDKTFNRNWIKIPAFSIVKMHVLYNFK
jgi:hypothetical protein